MKKLKLLFIGPYFPHSGASVFRMDDFTRNLMMSGHEVSIICSIGVYEIPKFMNKVQVNNINVYRSLCLSYKISHTTIDIFQIISTFFFTFIIALQKRIDFIFVSLPYASGGVPGIGAFFAAKILRKKIIFDVRDEWEDFIIQTSRFEFKRLIYKYFLKKFYSIMYSHASFIITVTPKILTRLNQRGILKVYIIPNGTNMNIFYPIVGIERHKIRNELGLTRQNFVIVYAGVLGGYYRVDIVLKSMSSIINQGYKNIKFVIIGDFDKNIKYFTITRFRFFNIIKDLDLEKYMVFLGRVSRDRAAKIMGVCDVGIIPYDDNILWSSAYSSKIFDYMGSGLPIIASCLEKSDLAELIDKNNIGIRVNPLNSDELANGILRLYEDEQLWKSMSINALTLVKEQFNREKLSQNLSHLLFTYSKENQE